MGTHPIFESDFDCLTDRLKYGRIQVLRSHPYGPTTQCLQKQPKTPMGHRWCSKARRTPWSYLPRKEITWCWQRYATQDSRWIYPCLMEEKKHFGSPPIQINWIFFYCSIKK